MRHLSSLSRSGDATQANAPHRFIVAHNPKANNGNTEGEKRRV